jgi:hypothetical protein
MKRRLLSKREGQTSRNVFLALSGLVVVAIAALWFTRPITPTQVADLSTPPVIKEKGSEVSVSTPPDGWIEMGGVFRPESDVQLDTRKSDDSGFPNKVLHGFSPPVSPVANKQVESVYASLKDRKNPRAFSSFEMANEFDLEAFKSDPDAYLNEIEPSRVFSPAQPGEGVSVLSSAGPSYHQVVQGESVILAVQAVEGAPVSLTSFDLGSFENELTSITVKADENGVARAKFTATGGTINEVKILAASPMTTGQVKFTVNVQISN